MRFDLIELRCNNDPIRGAVSFYIGGWDKQSQKVYLAKQVEFEAFDDSNAFAQVHREPSFLMTDHNTQKLMDELWRIGIRPSNGEGNVGQIGAMKEHLNDMRKIAFKQLKMNDAGSR